jgi:signal transduction histidine kinase
MAKNPAIYEGNRIIQELTINHLVKQFPIFDNISLINSSGAMGVSTAYRIEPDSTNFRNALQNARDGFGYYSEVRMSAEKFPVIDMSEPIRLHNELVGLLFVQVNLRAMWELVESSKIGEKGEAFIFDKNGKYLAHSDRMQVYLNNYFEEQEILDDISRGQQNERIYVNRQAIEMLAAYAPLFSVNAAGAISGDLGAFNLDSLWFSEKKNFNPLETGGKQSEGFQHLQWGLIIQQPTSEAFEMAQMMRFQIILVGLGSFLVAALLAMSNTRWIVLPVQKLMSGIERFAAGELEYEVETNGRDEIGQLSQRFNAMAKRILDIQDQLKKAERFETLSRMSSVLSHEIRNPLNSMVINLQIMRRELRKPSIKIEKLEKYLAIVDVEIKRLDELVRDFLLVSRPPKLNKDKAKLDDILNEIIISQQVLSLERGVRVERRFRIRAVLAFLDTAKIKQAFLNIYLNAVQAMSGGGKLIIGLALDQEPREHNPNPNQLFVRIEFSDTGKGIEPKELDRIFDFYYSTKDQGSGLGLSIAQQIIEEHGGQIKVISELKRGSTFFIRLPIESASLV